MLLYHVIILVSAYDVIVTALKGVYNRINNTKSEKSKPKSEQVPYVS